jgi:hypothetical protein
MENDNETVRVTEIEPIISFWHPEFGHCVYFRIQCDPPVRDYGCKQMHDVPERDGRAATDGFMTGFVGDVDWDKKPSTLLLNLN